MVKKMASYRGRKTTIGTLVGCLLTLQCWAHPIYQSSSDEPADYSDALLIALAAAPTVPDPGAAEIPLLIFRTTSPVQANMLGSGGGVSEADAICQSEANAAAYPGIYKALIGTRSDEPGGRFACWNANCTPSDPSDLMNWVLQPNSTYYRASDGVEIGTTNSNSLLNFPLTNSFNDSAMSLWHWSGFTNTWRAWSGPGGLGYPDNYANGWTAMSNGWLGHSYSTGTTAIDTGTSAGWNNSNLGLICVRQ